MVKLYYSLVFIILSVMIILGYILFVKIALRVIKALDIYIAKNTKE